MLDEKQFSSYTVFMKLDHEIIYDVRKDIFTLADKINRLEKKGLEYNGEKLYTSEVHTIEAIGKNRGSTVMELCRYFDITKGAVSQVIAKLHDKGLVDKERNPDYGKEKIITLTPAGWEVFNWHEEYHKKMDADFAARIGEVPEEHFVLFRGMIKGVLAAMDVYLEREDL